MFNYCLQEVQGLSQLDEEVFQYVDAAKTDAQRRDALSSVAARLWLTRRSANKPPGEGIHAILSHLRCVYVQDKQMEGPLIAAGIVPAAIALLYETGDYELVQGAIELLDCMAETSNAYKNAVLASMAPPVARLTVDPSSAHLEIVAVSRLIAEDGDDLQEVVVRSGAVRPIVGMLSASRAPASAVAASKAALEVVADRLAAGSPKARQALIAAGALPPLVSLLSGTYDDAKMAARAIEGIASGGGNVEARQEAAIEAGAISALEKAKRRKHTGLRQAAAAALTALGH